MCGTNSHKKYYANQENINRFTKLNQHATILDRSYNDLSTMGTVQGFLQVCNPSFTVNFPNSDVFLNEPQKPICIYNYYNLDPKWRKRRRCA